MNVQNGATQEAHALALRDGATFPAGGTESILAGKNSLQPLPQEWVTKEPPPLPGLFFTRDEKPRVFTPRGFVCSLVGSGGSGKSQSLIQGAVAAAAGVPWFDSYSVKEPGSTLVAFGEEDEDEYHRRVYWGLKGLGISADKERTSLLYNNLFPLPLRRQKCALLDNDGRETQFFLDLMRLLEKKEGGWSLIILDPARRFMNAAAEKDEDAGTAWVNCLDKMTMVKGNPTVMIGRHASKSRGLSLYGTDQGAGRGTSAITDAVRWEANLEMVRKKKQVRKGEQEEADPNLIRLRVVKRNYTRPTAPLDLQRNEYGVLAPASAEALAATEVDDAQSPVVQEVLEYIRNNPNSSTRNIALAIGRSRDAVTRAVKFLEYKKAIRLVGVGHRAGWFIFDTSGLTKPTPAAATEETS